MSSLRRWLTTGAQHRPHLALVHRAGFATTITAQLGSLSFGARSALIRDSLWAYLPQDFPQADQILLDSLGPEIPHCEVTGFDGFIITPRITEK